MLKQVIKYLSAALILLLASGISFTAGGGHPRLLLMPEAEAAVELSFDDLYKAASTEEGLVFSDTLKNAEGEDVVMHGFMAPPLTPTINFFVLTEEPMSICPFCSSDADWPANIVVVQLASPVTALPFDKPIRVEGILSLGTQVDAETGFVSLIRIQANDLSEE
jgi:hypothetical protein